MLLPAYLYFSYKRCTRTGSFIVYTVKLNEHSIFIDAFEISMSLIGGL